VTMKIVEDDFWGDGGDDDPASGNATAELDREWHARREEFWNSGYREGIEAGKHDTVQEGFDSGGVFSPPARPASAAPS
jgi:hypothetical protein